LAAATPVARAGLRALLAAEPADDLEIIGEAPATDGLPATVEALHPDVLLVDLAIAGESLLDGLPALTSAFPGLGVVLLGPAGDQAVREALAAGARAYLRLDAAGQELAAAVRAAALGLTVLDPATAGPLLAGLVGQAATPVAPLETTPPLTPRELQVLQLLAQGYTNRGIAHRLSISEHTAKFHVGMLLSKLGAASRAEAVARAARQGLVLL
jgi:DNA-binding NarL/FixJ family response regulator